MFPEHSRRVSFHFGQMGPSYSPPPPGQLLLGIKCNDTMNSNCTFGNAFRQLMQLRWMQSLRTPPRCAIRIKNWKWDPNLNLGPRYAAYTVICPAHGIRDPRSGSAST